MNRTLFYDTNALLNLQDKAFEEHFVIAQTTLQELESIKSSRYKDIDTKCKAQNLSKLLRSNPDSYTVMYYGEAGKELTAKYIDLFCPDTEIVTCAKSYEMQTGEDVLFVSDD